MKFLVGTGHRKRTTPLFGVSGEVCSEKAQNELDRVSIVRDGRLRDSEEGQRLINAAGSKARRNTRTQFARSCFRPLEDLGECMMSHEKTHPVIRFRCIANVGPAAFLPSTVAVAGGGAIHRGRGPRVPGAKHAGWQSPRRG